jgi:hypothetical protein|tara:strand:- start:295 stop:780 length:486 start_codon:yes stop_codon:yes gene_type:complete
MGCGMTYLPSELGLTPTEIQRDPRRAEEEGINFGVALSVIEGLIKLASLDSIPTPPVPPPTALLGGGRDGMSARRCAANIISRQSESGAPLGVRSNGEISVQERMETIRVQEITREITEKMRTTVAIPPGLSLVTTGANAGGPLVAYGATSTPGFGFGVTV